jgi:hypothetical protein
MCGVLTLTGEWRAARIFGFVNSHAIAIVLARDRE